MGVIQHPYTIKLWFPASAAEDTGAITIEMKAPEFGDTYSEGRNLTITQPKSGAVVVYDHGTPFTKNIKLQFKDIPDTERSALLVLLEQVGWGSSVLKYKDYLGKVRNVRVLTQRLDSKAQSSYNRDSAYPIYTFDFEIDLLDVTGNILEAQDTTIVPSALTLHIADLDSPHAPETTETVNIADGLKLLDTFLVDAYKGCIWIGVAVKGTARHMFQIAADHNGTDGADATTTASTITVSNDIGSSTGIISYDISLSGAGTSQVVRLRASTAANGWNIIFRRIHIGKT